MARQCLPLRQKFMECSIIKPVLSLLMKHLVIGQHQKAPNFSAFHWSPHGSLVSIGQHFVTMRVVHLLKRTETSLITELDRSGTKHQIGPGCAGLQVRQYLLLTTINNNSPWMVHFTHLYHYIWFEGLIFQSVLDIYFTDTRIGVTCPEQVSLYCLVGYPFC